MRYYLQYMEKYFPILKIRYKSTIQQDNKQKQEKILNEIKDNKFLTDKQKEDILRQLTSQV